MNYLRFELRLLLTNKKNWLLGVALILLMPIYYLHYSSLPVKDAQTLKNEESKEYSAVFYHFPEGSREIPKGKEIYDHLTRQQSLVNNQRFALWKGDVDHAEYIRSGLELNESRLQVHALGNTGIPDYYVIPKEEIHKEIALLTYYFEHDLPFIKDPFVASNYIPFAFNWLSGILFTLFVLLIGSTMYVHDQQKRSVLGMFPVTFMQKVWTKTGLHLAQVLTFLSLSVMAGITFVANKAGMGSFRSPVLLYQDGDYIAISTTRYLFYMFVALALVTLLLLLATAFLNIVTKNLYVSLLTILLITVLPMILSFAGLPVKWIQALEFIDIGAVIDGEAALRTGSRKLDFKHGLFWLIGLNGIMLTILYVKNRLTYRNLVKGPVLERGSAE